MGLSKRVGGLASGSDASRRHPDASVDVSRVAKLWDVGTGLPQHGGRGLMALEWGVSEGPIEKGRHSWGGPFRLRFSLEIPTWVVLVI